MPVVVRCPITTINITQKKFAEMIVEAPEIADLAKPGQFVHIKCGQAQILRRPISICDAENGKVRIFFEIKGAGTQWLAERKTGENLDILGPLGNGYTLSDEKSMVVGGGIGVPPMLFLAKNLENCDGVLGFRSRNNAILISEFEKYCGFVDITTDDGTLGSHGYVDAAVKARLELGRYRMIYVCGPKVMLKAVSQVAEKFGIPCQVSLEERMGCGIGACLVCACKTKTDQGTTYKHVCKDGPVFSSGEVVWDD